MKPIAFGSPDRISKSSRVWNLTSTISRRPALDNLLNERVERKPLGNGWGLFIADVQTSHCTRFPSALFAKYVNRMSLGFEPIANGLPQSHVDFLPTGFIDANREWSTYCRKSFECRSQLIRWCSVPVGLSFGVLHNFLLNWFCRPMNPSRPTISFR